MDFEHINEDDLVEMENMETSPVTDEEKHYIETTERLKVIEKKLDHVLTTLCIITSNISNIVTLLQHMDNCILLRE